MSHASEIAELRSAVDRAAALYYVPGSQSDLTDAEYDVLVNRLRVMCPDDPRLTRVGVPYSREELRTKTPHTIPMGSIDKTDGGIAGFERWYRGILDKLGLQRADLHVSLKMDGSSVGCYYKNGLLSQVVSRGDGTQGENLTANAVKWIGLPTSLPIAFTGAIRGEAMLYKAGFDAINMAEKVRPDQVSNPRNVGNGLLGRSDGKYNEHIRLVVFNLAGTNNTLTLGQKLAAVQRLGFDSVQSYLLKGSVEEVVAQFKQVHDTVFQNRDSLPFEIDGLVICLDDPKLQAQLTKEKQDALRPKYAVAVKFETYKNVTTVKGVTITVGHTGSIIPTAILEPVRVGGVMVSHVLLNNWNANSDRPSAAHVKIGDKISVELAGDIIPKVVAVEESGFDSKVIVEPRMCPACGSPTTRVHRGECGVVTYCSKPELCPAASLYRIDHYIGSSKKGVGILGIGDAVLLAMVGAGLVKSPADLYRLTPESIENLEIGQNTAGGAIKLGRSRALTIVRNIKDHTSIPLDKFLGALGIDLLGKRRAQTLAKECGLNTLADWFDDRKLAAIPGDVIQNAIVEGIKKARPVIDGLLAVGVKVLPIGAQPHIAGTTQAVKTTPTHSKVDLTGKSFCWTGTRAYTDEVEACGGIIKSGISAGLDYLVQKDSTSSSNKTLKAESLNVKIISLECLQQVLAGDRPLP